jgi:hypothetical protein
MRLEAKIINALYESIVPAEQAIALSDAVVHNSPVLGEAVQAVSPKHFSFRELKKNARDIMLLTSSNLNSLFKVQGCNVRIESAKFIDFSFSASSLVATFKAVFVSPDNSQYESSVCVCWNGDKVTIN